MNPLSALALGLAWLAIVGISWLGWQLLRQNGRLLLRLEELEKRLDEVESGEGEEPKGLPVGSEAPAFELSDLAGQRHTLAQYRGQALLLLFFNPDCGYCRELAPKLAALPPHPGPLPLGGGEGGRSPGEGNTLVFILTTGEAEKNDKFFAEHQTSFPVLLQNDGEVAKAYHANGTPSGYLVNAEGKIASPLAIGADALLALATEPCSSRGNEAQTSPRQPSTLNSHPNAQSLLTSAATHDGADRAGRIGNRSLSRSKIKREGLKAGTPAPDFRLPRLDGRGELSLEEFRGRRVLLVFSSPHCGPCLALAPELEKFHRAHTDRDRSPVAARGHANATGLLDPPDAIPSAANGYLPRSEGIAVVMISKGEPKENRAKVKEHGLTFPVVLQQQWEISRRYAMFATPVAYLIDGAGIIAKDVAVGVAGIQALMGEATDGDPNAKGVQSVSLGWRRKRYPESAANKIRQP